MGEPSSKRLRPLHAENLANGYLDTPADFDIFSLEESTSSIPHSTFNPLAATTTATIPKREIQRDSDGFAIIKPGDTLEFTDDNKFSIVGQLGKGSFGIVYKAITKSNELVAIKIFRCNPLMRKSGEKEAEIYAKIASNERKNEKGHFIVSLLHNLELNKLHLCLCFELLNMNARDLLKKFGKNTGISLNAIRVYTRQLLSGLQILKRSGIVHGDIKPDNILISANLATAKLCDFGSADFHPCLEVSSYKASRYYRSPEVILGSPLHGHPIDIWALACTLFELYTGQILFNGDTNNEMLFLMIQTLGKFPIKMVRPSHYREKHFDESLQFRRHTATRSDPRSTTAASFEKSELSIANRLKGQELGDDPHHLQLFTNFLLSCLTLQPEKRLTPKSALSHPFLVYN